MAAAWENFLRNWTWLAMPFLVLLITMIAGWFVRRVLFQALEGWARKSESELDDLVVHALRGPFMLWVMILGLHLAMQVSDLPFRVTSLAGKALLVLWIISLTLVASKVAGSLVRHYGRGVASILPVTTLTQSLASLAVATTGVLILLD